MSDALNQLDQFTWHDFEVELFKNKNIIEKVKNNPKEYPYKLYSSLCNSLWVKDELVYGCSWRYSGSLIAFLLNVVLDEEKYDYLNFYSTGAENIIDDEISKDLLEMGWKACFYPPFFNMKSVTELNDYFSYYHDEKRHYLIKFIKKDKFNNSLYELYEIPESELHLFINFNEKRVLTDKFDPEMILVVNMEKECLYTYNVKNNLVDKFEYVY